MDQRQTLRQGPAAARQRTHRRLGRLTTTPASRSHSPPPSSSTSGANSASRPYTPEEYRYAADDHIPQNGAYFGVSWFQADRHPRRLNGKRIFLHIRGAHLRAEVYLNQKLVGYSIMEELPFECDCTDAANPGGLNVLAIRITNPFGRFDWVDGLNAKWGKVSLYRSHGFGALDRGITTQRASSEIRISDVWVLNTPEPAERSESVELKFIQRSN